jgi:ribonucleoside-diphosphate reductase alpha chain
MELSAIGEKIFKLKYAVDENETWDDACLRVASHVASAEKKFGKSDEEVKEVVSEYFQAINNLYFIPGGRILANSGTKIKSLMNCFVIPVGDSRESIYQSLKDAAEVFAQGGGVGYNFSDIRERGAAVKGTGGRASGPVSFITLFDQTGEVIEQASRRGAQMALLDIDHPDIEEFIDFKSVPNKRNVRLLEEYDRNLTRYANGKLKGTKYHDVLTKTLLDDQLTHFNVSISISDAFMQAASKGESWNLIRRNSNSGKNANAISPVGERCAPDSSVAKVIPAKELLEKIATRAWESGDPGVLFYDRVNRDNMCPYLGDLRATNPCGEVTLLPLESCCLGSINLSNFVTNGTIDLKELEEVTRLGVRFLDNVQEVSINNLEKIDAFSKSTRRLGLGVMGWADALVKMNLPYNSDNAYKLAGFLSWYISCAALIESMKLARERGTFSVYDKDRVKLDWVEGILNSEYSPTVWNMQEVRENGFRNISVTSIAPTGSIALLCGVNSSIEPYFGLAYRRFITEGIGNTAKDSIMEINPLLFESMQYEMPPEEFEKAKEIIVKTGSAKDTNFPGKEIFVISKEIAWIDHIRMQAAWQNYITNAVSKTINCSTSTTVEEVYNIYMEMWKAGLKGGTVYRENSKMFQILNLGQ